MIKNVADDQPMPSQVNPIVFREETTRTSLPGDGWRPPRWVTATGSLLLVGAFGAGMLVVLLLWLISLPVAFIFAFDSSVGSTTAERGFAVVIAGGIFIWGAVLLCRQVIVRDERFVIDPVAQAVSWEKDYRWGRTSKRPVAFDLFVRVSLRSIFGADAESFDGVGLETREGNRQCWRQVSVHNTSAKAQTSADRLRAKLISAGWVTEKSQAHRING